MDDRQFLADFALFANAPGGIARLRELILRLAIQGRLVSQSDAEERSDAFLTRISAEKGSTLGGHATDAPESGEPVGMPPGWAIARVHQIAYPQPGYAFKASLFNQSGIGLPIIRVRDVGVNRPTTFYSGDYRSEFIVRHGDWLIAMDGDFRVAEWQGQHALLNQRVVRLQFYSEEIAKKYVCIALQFELSKLQGAKNYTTVDHLSGRQIGGAQIALPPAGEQSRIVAKVDELTALCDKLVAEQQDRRKLQDALRETTIAGVAASATSHELHTNWTRLNSSFGQLFTAADDVRVLRDAILDLALRGLLLPHARLPNTSNVSTQSLPGGWTWKTLGDDEVSEYIISGSRSWKEYIAPAGDVFIRSQDIKNDALIFDNPAFVLLPDKVEGKRTLVCEGDLLLTITGGNVGKCAIVKGLSRDAYVSQHVALIRLKQTWLSDFIHLWMISSFGGRRFLSRYIYGDKPGLNLTQVGSVPIPVPSKADCATILNGLRRYHTLCDALRRQLQSRHKLASALATAAVSTFTGIVSTEDQLMKAPETDLVAPLRLGTTPEMKAHAPLATLLARMNGELPARELWQRFGGEIDAFYAQLKTEVTRGWIREPGVAVVRERLADTTEE